MIVQPNPIKKILIEFENNETYKLDIKNKTETELYIKIIENALDLHIYSYDELIMEKYNGELV